MICEAFKSVTSPVSAQNLFMSIDLYIFQCIAFIILLVTICAVTG